MYYNKGKMIVSIMWIIIGLTLIVLSFMEIVDSSFCAGLGGGWIAVGVMQLYRNKKYHSDENYKEKIDIEASDERNRYIRMKAWSWAGYLFVIISGIGSIILHVIGQETYGQILSYSLCLILVLYVVAYIILQKKD